MISIEYNDLLKKYDKILISTSRGFDTKHDFLESWVPNPDLNQSVSDLLNSAIDYSIKELEIIFNDEEIKSLKLDFLKKKFLNLGKINLINNKLTFLFTKDD
tara:strand:- start:1563 stop:1868 length:306 start_codon:yes stop_codon:yes gene_type:complete